MNQLELLAPARDMEIGIAAIDCGADAVYIAGPRFGARQAAGNEIDSIRKLCGYAHRYGARIFVALNTILYDDELEDAYRQMLLLQDAGIDAIIVQDMAVLEMAGKGIGNIHEDFHIPLHASTQCAIRTPEQARFLEGLGFSRLILERGLSIKQIRDIREAVSCELEAFIHGAICVCYSGQCYLSEYLAGRSANRGACIQACRSRYDLIDESGKTLVKDKALLSLKDFNLHDRLEELAAAGISSFKIEGRLKNSSYVRNVVRYHSSELDRIVEKYPDLYERGSYGSVRNSFDPDPFKTFNRGYTEYFIDGKRGRWAAMDAAKSMGEEVGKVTSISRDRTSFTIKPAYGSLVLNNGDGFSFIDRKGEVCGFRGDVCSGNAIRCKANASLYPGAILFRNIDSAFEKEMERHPGSREIMAIIKISFVAQPQAWKIRAEAMTEDGRIAVEEITSECEAAVNRERMEEIVRAQLCKSSGIYRFTLESIKADDGLPFMSVSTLNALRRDLAAKLDTMGCKRKDILRRELSERAKITLPQKDVTYKTNISNNLSLKLYASAGAESIGKAYELSHTHGVELMRTKYCIRHELGICPIHHHSKDKGPLYLINNGRKLKLHFDCRNCEMTVLVP